VTSLLEAFELVEAVQGEDSARAADRLGTASSESPVVLFVLATARTVHAVVRGEPAPVEGLLATAADAAETAIALGLQGLVCATEGDTAGLLSACSRAIALLDDPALPGPQRCLAHVITAAALNTLRVWELVDELYAAALSDPAAAALARQSEAVAINRVLIGLEHGLALLITGDEPAARTRLREAAALVEAALVQDLRPHWRHDAMAARDVVHLLLGEPVELPVEEHLAALTAEGDLEVLPLLEAAIALTGGAIDAHRPVSASSGARSFPLWVRARVLADGSPAALAAAEHAQLAERLLWESRSAVLAAVRAQVGVERRRVEHDRLARAVHTDPLTGLHNRRRFDDWLQRPGSGPTALLLLDLDGFKAVNDRHGHAAGDEVLRRLGLILRAAVRPNDLAVRQGGDEFAVVLQDPDLDEAAVLSRAEGIARTVADEDWGGIDVRVSIGAALATDPSGPSLYAAADAALYRAKRDGLPPVLADR
jgi:diguanylate cyclase (GGDEF)-like protein